MQVNNLDYHQKAIVTKDTRPVKTTELLAPTVASVIIATVLLHTIVSGDYIELFELIDFKIHYFIKAKAYTHPTELQYRLSMTEEGMKRTERKYVIQLRALLNEHSSSLALMSKIDRAGYDENSLRSIVLDMNTINGGQVNYASSATAKKILMQFYVGAGVDTSSLKFSGAYPAFERMRFSRGFVSAVSAGVDNSSARNLQDLILRAELLYSTVSYKGTGSRMAPPGGPRTWLLPI